MCELVEVKVNARQGPGIENIFDRNGDDFISGDKYLDDTQSGFPDDLQRPLNFLLIYTTFLCSPLRQIQRAIIARNNTAF